MSKKKETQTQCKLTKEVWYNNSFPSYLTQIVWIPTKYAVLGGTVKIKSDDGTWVDGWKVMAVYSTEDTAKVVEQAHAHTRQRGTSDI